jgi:hypothetical protein
MATGREKVFLPNENPLNPFSLHFNLLSSREHHNNGRTEARTIIGEILSSTSRRRKVSETGNDDKLPAHGERNYFD